MTKPRHSCEDCRDESGSRKNHSEGQYDTGSGAQVLGVGQRRAHNPPAKKIAMIREGVDVALLIGAGQYYGIAQSRLSRLIGVSDVTVTRQIKTGGRLSPQESRRPARIAAVEVEAEDVFDSPDLARRWMLEPNLALGEPPLSLLDTDAGADEVKKALASIAYGGAARCWRGESLRNGMPSIGPEPVQPSKAAAGTARPFPRSTPASRPRSRPSRSSYMLARKADRPARNR